MAGLIEKNAKTAITIRQRSRILDGKPSWYNYSANAMVMDYSFDGTDKFGKIQNGKIFLVAPMSAEPKLPGIVVCDKIEYEIKLENLPDSEAMQKWRDSTTRSVG